MRVQDQDHLQIDHLYLKEIDEYVFHANMIQLATKVLAVMHIKKKNHHVCATMDRFAMMMDVCTAILQNHIKNMSADIFI